MYRLRHLFRQFYPSPAPKDMTPHELVRDYVILVSLLHVNASESRVVQRLKRRRDTAFSQVMMVHEKCGEEDAEAIISN